MIVIHITPNSTWHSFHKEEYFLFHHIESNFSPFHIPGISLGKENDPYKWIRIHNHGSNVQDLVALTNETLSISIMQKKSKTITSALHSIDELGICDPK